MVSPAGTPADSTADEGRHSPGSRTLTPSQEDKTAPNQEAAPVPIEPTASHSNAVYVLPQVENEAQAARAALLLAIATTPTARSPTAQALVDLVSVQGAFISVDQPTDRAFAQLISTGHHRPGWPLIQELYLVKPYEEAATAVRDAVAAAISFGPARHLHEGPLTEALVTLSRHLRSALSYTRARELAAATGELVHPRDLLPPNAEFRPLSLSEMICGLNSLAGKLNEAAGRRVRKVAHLQTSIGRMIIAFGWGVKMVRVCSGTGLEVYRDAEKVAAEAYRRFLTAWTLVYDVTSQDVASLLQ